MVLKETIEAIFTAVLLLLKEGGYIQLENYFVDGTKIEANANKYSFVWAKNTQRYKEQVQAKVGALLDQVEQLNAAEDAELGERDLPERGGAKPLDAAQLEAKIRELNERLRQMSADGSSPATRTSPAVPDRRAASGGDASGSPSRRSPRAEAQEAQIQSPAAETGHPPAE